MISVRGVTKRYGSARSGDGRPALDDVSFEVDKAEIVGLLGPNGAGKTTLMRILSCFMAPTRGTAVLAGCSISEDTRGVRRALGYLPEAVPLPPEMRVTEYLAFRASLKAIGRDKRRAAVDDAIQIAGLGERRAQIIGTLSRGYRQRVGLDPNQIRETHALIRELGRERAVLLSTHILSDVEALAGRVVIVDRGRVKASGTPAALRESLGAASLDEVFAKVTSETSS